MASNDTTEPKVSSGIAYLAAWILGQLTLNATWLLPWITKQLEVARSSDIPLPPLDASTVLHAGVACLVSTLGCLAFKVWKELEADAVHGAANLCKAAPTMAKDLLGRCWDAVWGTVSRLLLFSSFTRRYLADLRHRYGLFNDKGLGLINANRLDLDKVYVELQAAPGVNLHKANFNPVTESAVTREITHSAPLWDHLRTLRPGFALAMIGAPGCGKTTLLHHALLTFARNRQWLRRMRFRLPIFIELRKVHPELGSESNKLPTLPKVIESLWRKDSFFKDLLTHLPKTWLSRWLKSGRCLLLWDGLDEVAEHAQRKRVRDWLESQVLGSADYRQNLHLVTARPAGYQDAPLDHAQALEVQPFCWDDTKRFVQQWYHATEVVSSGNVDNAAVRRRANDESRELLTKLQDLPKLGELSVNPLLLTMICMVHRFHGALPGSRGQLYDEICQVLLERWRQTRGMADTYSSQQKMEVLRPLALWLMENRVKEMSQEQMLTCVAEPLTRIGVPAGKAAALAFMIELRDSSGLWLEREAKLWGFAHLTFQEHLCADAWKIKPDLRPSDWSRCLADSWWREALLLFSGRADDATPLASAAMDGDTSSRAFALQLLDEKINITAAARQRMEQTLLAALASKEKELFIPAAQAWLARQQERNYQRLDEQGQISGWVTAAEYHLFILTASGMEDLWRIPLCWTDAWFASGYATRILGLSARHAEEYCAWLNKTQPGWNHRLPSEEELAVVASGDDGTSGCSAGGMDRLKRKVAEIARLIADRGLYRDPYLSADLALDQALALDLNRALALDQARSSDLDLNLILALARDLALALDLARDRDHALELARDLSRGRGLDLDREQERGLAPDLALAIDLERAIALALAFDPDLNLNRVRSMDKVDDQIHRLQAENAKTHRVKIQLLRAWRLVLIGTTYPVIYRAVIRFISLVSFELCRSHKIDLGPAAAQLEATLQHQVACALGEAQPKEGLRIVRERRQ